MKTGTFDLKRYLSLKRDIVNAHLDRIICYPGLDKELTQAMRYSLMAGGKRLRPILCMASAEACGKDPIIALPCACAMEMIHTYSLIHDDLPAMDNDDFRRGIPTCHKRFSDATAVLAGDGLLTYAFQLLSSPGTYFERFPDDSTLLKLIAVISDAAGINGMIEGQMMDMLAQGQVGGNSSEKHGSSDREKALNHLKIMHRLKTGKMIIGSVEAGAISAGADASMRQCLASYADCIGLAFQVTDDILNVEGDPELMGKAVGSDALNDKMTFPSLLGLNASKKLVDTLVSEAIHALEPLNKNNQALAAIASYVRDRKR